MIDPASLISEAKDQVEGSEAGDLRRKTALVTGSVAVGAVLTSSIFRRVRRLTLQEPEDLRSPVDAESAFMEFMEGRACYYRREGSGVPLVLLHSINAAASTYEMKPIFEHLSERTSRPIYALDWIGFGRSDRPPVRYSARTYVRQLRRFLSEYVHQPADIIALSQAAEYVGELARTLPYLVRRLVLISPTGIASSTEQNPWRRAVLSLSDSVGAFEIFYYRLTRAALLRRFYERQVFRRPNIPDDLVGYAEETSLVVGAHHAPRYFIQGDLALGYRPYGGLAVPTLMTAPEDDSNLVQQFEGLEELANENPNHIRIERLPAGLLPQWEAPEALYDSIDRFLA